MPPKDISSQVHCVLVDFSCATQSVDEQDMHRTDDFGCCLRILSYPGVGLDGELVWENYAPREAWDLFSSTVKIGGELRWRNSADPFAFVYEP